LILRSKIKENAAHSGRHLPAYAVKCYLLER